MRTTSNGGNEKNSNQSSDKLLQIMEALAKERLPVRLQDLSAQVNMSQSTVLRYLNALQSANYVYQEESTSRYALTWKICGLSEHLNSNLGLRSITAPYITELVNKLNLGVCLVIEQDHDCVYLDCVDASPSFQHTFQRIGKRAPHACHRIWQTAPLPENPIPAFRLSGAPGTSQIHGLYHYFSG